jgi:hypothetical protein
MKSAIGPEILHGAYDTHVHAAPDVVPRVRDYLAAAREAEAAGMAGIIFKDLSQPSTDRAYAVNELSQGLTAYGGIVLDLPVGGLNPMAVERALRHGATVVWMPVAHAENTVALYETGLLTLTVPPDIPRDRALSVLSPDGLIRDEVREIVTLISDHEAVLATGHSGPDESLALIHHARRAGISRIVVNHPCGTAIGASVEQQQAMAEAGALLEHCYAQCTPGLDGLPIKTIAEAIMAVGPEHCILGTDLGQTFNPPPVEGLMTFLRSLHKEGLSLTDLEMMVRHNPAHLFAVR